MNSTAHLPSRYQSAGVAGSAAAAGALLLLIGLVPHKERALLLTDGQLQAKAFAAAVAPLDPKQAQLEAGLLQRLADPKPRHRDHANPGPGQHAPIQLADAGPTGFPNPGDNDAGFAAPPNTFLGGAPGGGQGLPPGDSSSSSGGSVPNFTNPVGAAPNAITAPGGGSSGGSSSGGGNPGGTTSGGTTSGGATSGGTTSSGGLTSGGTTTSGGAAPGGTTSGGLTSGGTTPKGTTSSSSSSGGDPNQVSAVPELNTWVTMIAGFFLIGATIRRNKRKTIPNQSR